MMPKDNRYSEAARKAAEETDQALADDLALRTPYTAEEVRAMFPTRADQELLGELLEIVRRATDQNTKVATLVSNMERLGPAVIRVLEAALGAPRR